MNSFSEHYELHRSIDDVAETFLKSPANKHCKFCNKPYPDVSFDNVPHIIPELFGRNKWTSNFECDLCNEKFQKFEVHTATMTQHYLSILQIKTKNGIPTFQSFKKPYEFATVIKTIEGNLSFNFGANLGDFQFNEENNSVSFFLKTKRFRPFFVYKTFLKIGLSLLTREELETNDHYHHFLESEVPIKNGMQFWRTFRYILKTKYYSVPKANLYKAKNTIDGKTVYPEYILILYFANVVFQFFLPISKKNIIEHSNDNNLVIEMFPSFALDDIASLSSIEIHNLELNETKPSSMTDSMTFYYDRLYKDVNVAEE